MRRLLMLAALWYALPAAAIQLTIGQNYTGSTQATSGYVPPDSMGAVGLQHVTEFVNGEFRAYDKATGTLLQQISNDRFWLDAGVAADGAFDPRMQYDAFVDRWYALSSGSDAFLFAVSNGGDPTAGWTAFEIDADSTDTFWVDFPMLGFDADGVYFSANMIPNSGVGNWRTEVVVVPKADLIGTAPTVARATVFERISLAQLVWTPQLAIDLDGAGLPMPILAVSIPSALQSAQIEGPVTAPALGGLADVIWDPDEAGSPPDAEQPGPAQNLEVFGLARFTSNTVVRNGTLWGARAVEHFTADGNRRSAVQWWQIDPDTDTLLQIGYIADDELDLFEPSIAVNEFEQVVIGLNGSSEGQFVSAYAVAGETIDGVTTFGNLVLLVAGLGPYEQVYDGRNRWGDYSATVVDPSDPYRFWTFQEWADAGNAWATQITELVLVPEPPDCSNTLDDDGDGLTDLDDPGCADGSDVDEHSPTLACDDGTDNDGDGTADFLTAGGGDLGCYSIFSSRENPQCQDGLDNDGLAGIDFDGGDSLDINPRDGFIDAQFNAATPAVGEADPQCVGFPWRVRESSNNCGLGFELVFLTPLLARLTGRRRA